MRFFFWSFKIIPEKQAVAFDLWVYDFQTSCLAAQGVHWGTLQVFMQRTPWISSGRVDNALFSCIGDQELDPWLCDTSDSRRIWFCSAVTSVTVLIWILDIAWLLSLSFWLQVRWSARTWFNLTKKQGGRAVTTLFSLNCLLLVHP